MSNFNYDLVHCYTHHYVHLLPFFTGMDHTDKESRNVYRGTERTADNYKVSTASCQHNKIEYS
jgi:hypothetical protein